jgi:hypothetical protein
MAMASVVPPPNPKNSCASAEYEVQGRDPTGQSFSSSDDLLVVAGTAPLNTTDILKMDQQVTVCIMGLHHWKQKNDPTALRLYIGGDLLARLVPTISPSGQEYLNFNLQMDTADSEDWKAWAAIVDASRHSADAKQTISVGIPNKGVFESNAAVTINPYPKSWPFLLAGFVVLLAALVWLAATTDLLRYAVGKRPTLPEKSPFSLGLLQMALWFYLALAAYVYICVSTHQIHIPMGSVLGLLGISSTTGLAAVFVDKGKEASSQNQRTSLLTEQAALNARTKELQSVVISPGSAAETELVQKKSRLAEVDAALAQLPEDPRPATTKNFIKDILNDGDTVSFHRFQMVIWSIVLGAVFVWAVYRNMSMPEFDASLLTLMGISSGTYVGFKFPEKPK